MQEEEERTEWIFPPPAFMQDRGTQARRRHFLLWDVRCDSVCRWAPIKRRHSLIHSHFFFFLFFANNGPGISNRAPKSCVLPLFCSSGSGSRSVSVGVKERKRSGSSNSHKQFKYFVLKWNILNICTSLDSLFFSNDSTFTLYIC